MFKFLSFWVCFLYVGKVCSDFMQLFNFPEPLAEEIVFFPQYILVSLAED